MSALYWVSWAHEPCAAPALSPHFCTPLHSILESEEIYHPRHNSVSVLNQDTPALLTPPLIRVVQRHLRHHSNACSAATWVISSCSAEANISLCLLAPISPQPCQNKSAQCFLLLDSKQHRAPSATARGILSIPTIGIDSVLTAAQLPIYIG